jgi:hypothetical protein
MKRLSLYLFLVIFTLQTPSWADDIRDFQIEGISIGDTLLDYISESEIKENKYYAYKLKDYYQTYFELPVFETYDGVQVNIKDGDNNFTIASVEGGFRENFSKCKQKKKKIEKELISLFPNLKVVYGEEYSVPSDPSGLSKTIITDLYFNTSSEGASIRVMCVDRSKKIEEEKDYFDSLRVIINSKEFNMFLEKNFNP